MNETTRAGGGRESPRITPFPFASLPAISRAEVEAQRHARALPVATLETALAAVIGAEVTIALRRGRPAERAADQAVVAALSPFDGDGVYVVEAEPALAREIVMRALKTPPSRIADPSRTASAEMHGAFAAVLLAALRNTPAPPLRVVGVSAGAVEPRGTTASFAVTVAGATFGARFTFPGSFAPPLVIPDLTIALPLAIAHCLAKRGDVEALRPGDVFLPPRLALVGPVALIAPRSERGIAGDLADGGRLVIRTDRAAEHAWDAPIMAEHHTTLEVALDAPVVVRVELGVVEMKAREWAALAEGDVLSLGKKLGDPAVLRVGGVEVARGELVQVDGEYGIRLVEVTR